MPWRPIWPRAAVAAAVAADSRISFKTWEDHYLPEQLKEMRSKQGITVKVSFADDNLTNFEQLKRGVDYDVVTADALWVPRFLEEGLIEPFDPADLSTWGDLYSVAREVPFWTKGSLYTCYPHAWSPHLLYYNPAEVRTPPDSWEALLDSRTAARSCSPRSRTTSWRRPAARPGPRSRSP